MGQFLLMISIFSTAFLTSCLGGKSTNSPSFSSSPRVPASAEQTTKNESSSSRTVSVESFELINYQFRLTGQNLDSVSNVWLKSQNGESYSARIIYQTAKKLHVVLKQSIEVIFDQTFDFVLSAANAQTVFPVTFNLGEKSIEASMLSDMGARDGEYLQFFNGVWRPVELKGPTYQGTWNAQINSPAINSTIPLTGDYYIVGVAGTTNIDGTSSWAQGDWAIYNGSIWEKIEASSAVVNWGDINKVGSSLDDLGDVDTTSIAPTLGQTLKWNGGQWVPGDDATGSGSWGSSGANFYFNSGSVGIGNSSPSKTLDVTGDAGVSGHLSVGGNITVSGNLESSGEIKVGNASTACSASEGGRMRYNSSLKVMQYCNETTWVSIGSKDNEVPSATVAFFNLSSCPTGWSEVTGARGRVIVAMPSSGTLTGTQGSALTDLAQRTITDVPAHTHTIDPPSTSSSTNGSHTHDIYSGRRFLFRTDSVPGGAGGTGGWIASEQWITSVDSAGSHNHTVDIASFSSASTGSASVDVTMPYIQFLACSKD